VELESDERRIILDIGLPLDAEDGGPQYLPEMDGLETIDPSLLGILISHPHLDHFGLLPHVSPKLPVGMGPAARRILAAAAPFMPGEWTTPGEGWDYVSGESRQVGPFQVTPYLVDHSAYDSYSLLIEAEGKRLFYSGDFRAHGRKGSLFQRMLDGPPTSIDTLLLEGSSLGRITAEGRFKTEAELESEFVQIFSDTVGLAMVHTSSQNIDRVVSILKASKQCGRKLVIDLYTAVILEATGNRNIPQSSWEDVVLFIPQSQRVKIKENEWFSLLKHHSRERIFPEHLKADPGRYTLLFRPLHQRDLNRANCLGGCSFIYSQWSGYWDRGDYDHVKTWLAKHGISEQHLHTSGHASLMDLKRFVKAVKPGKVVPIHTFQPESYMDLFENVELHRDGDWWEV